ncbi:MarR family winged helix-turn-helix transcriptional regulator [Paenibacillus sp. NPDC058071]|uniref:MarR family winged helix-turn-helix transcriptional regulator n=1 Tax=Paenibacillus sp. NPDC058071 TaxID=3346326 RepID=UPI0036DD5AA8
MNKEALQSIEFEIATLIRRINASNKKAGSLDRSAYLLLHHISSYGSAGVKALSEDFRLDISTVSRQAAALEQKGYVTRHPDPTDGRAFSLAITELGMKELLETREQRQALVARRIEDWPEEESLLFGQLLRKFNDSLMKE